MTSPDAASVTFGHGAGEDGSRPAAWVECWIWSMEGGKPHITFAGIPPRGDKAWVVACWRAVAAEAERQALEEELGEVQPPA